MKINMQKSIYSSLTDAQHAKLVSEIERIGRENEEYIRHGNEWEKENMRRDARDFIKALWMLESLCFITPSERKNYSAELEKATK